MFDYVLGLFSNALKIPSEQGDRNREAKGFSTEIFKRNKRRIAFLLIQYFGLAFELFAEHLDEIRAKRSAAFYRFCASLAYAVV